MRTITAITLATILILSCITGVAQMALDNSTYLGGSYNASAFTGYSVVRENINTGNTEYFSFIPPSASTSLYYYWH